MPIDPLWILAYLALGVAVGFFAGLLGVGGGGIMVPILTALFSLQGMPFELVVHSALATSMATIMVTSLSSLRAHHAKHAVLWPIVWRLTPGILAGTFSATFIASRVGSRPLTIFFACFMAYIAVQMIINIKPQPSRQLPGPQGLALVGTGIGGLSALAAIGGGVLSVPFLTWCNVSIQKAIGTAAAIGFPIAVAGTLGYLINGWRVPGMPAWHLGYIYLPAALVIGSVSYVTAPIGVKFAHSLPVPMIRKLFAGLLVALCLKMLHTVFSN